jgi:hypothetical protein
MKSERAVQGSDNVGSAALSYCCGWGIGIVDDLNIPRRPLVEVPGAE